MKNISVKWAVIFVVFLAVFAAVLVLYFQASSAADVVHPAGFGTGLQNSGIFCNPSGSMIYVSAQDGSLTAFGENGEKSWELKTRGIVNDMAFDTVNGIAYVGSDDHNIYILNATTGEVLEKKDIGLKVYKLDVTPGGDMLLVSAGISSPKHKILLYDGHGNELLNIPAGTIVRAAGFNNDRTEFFTGDDNGNLRIYDLKGNILKSARMNSQIFAAQYTESGMYVYVKRGLFYTFDSDLNQTLQVQVSDPKVDGWAMAATPDDKWVGFAVSSPAKDAGVFILTNSDGAEQVSSHYDVPVTGIAVTDKHMYFTGPGDFIYRLDIDQMQTVKLLGQYKQLLFVLSLTLPIVLLFLLAMAVLSIRRVVRRFFEILYKHRLAYLLLLPTFALIAVFGYYPVFMAVTRAFTNWSARSPTIKFVGFENFVTMVKEGYFLTGVGNMLILLVAGLIKTLTVPLLVAKLINSLIKRRQKYWFRFLFVLPMIVPGIVTTLMWQNIYDPQVGLLNQLLTAVGLGNLAHVWLGDPATAIWAIVGIGFPWVSAFAFLVLYGGLIGISGELTDAARVDGCGPVRNFFGIQLPLLLPQIKLLVILTCIGTIQDFGSIYLLTKGGPGKSTYVPGLELFFNATQFGRYGYACALGLVMFIVIFALTLANNKIKVESDF